MSTSVIAETYLLLGTNQGNRMELLDRALMGITQKIGDISKSSSVYETAAWGNENQPNYLNQAVLVFTRLLPFQLLKTINAIEKGLGRERSIKWGSRPIDIDILWYADQIIDKPNLQIPHPHLPNRKFALIPLQEIAPTLVHPVFKKTITELLQHTPDCLPVHLYKTDTYEQD
ncbi:2-amino-4-hydroxy-6-hydroxymethyldihydropteridine diphosphokinase [Parapedobacter tibetensis]|uniref:2-amino-4-hydroxy-6- hydroxymethyldihydropteridine diphosphokinase n=1 Tax=Parapedobacter tibetensis TaxID=2972951 RepID=UPI00214D16A7|nr:2-amino-4-hydroxy-6-hydroxymethyldihydropteridine diphosphokinase [Parapedobacter tibetensis]